MGTITKNFSYSEFEKTKYSQFAEQNKITDSKVRDAIKALCENVLQPLRDAWGAPLTVSSGYRCKALNDYVPRASKTSQHMKGEAADIIASSPYNLASLARSLGLPYDQMILYNDFVHFSHKLSGAQRGEIKYDSFYTGAKLQ